MAVGTVVRFDEGKGYGFIAPDDGGEDVFVHATELTDRGVRVSTGTRVGFNMVDGGRGLKAYDVQVLDHQQPATAVKAAVPSNSGGTPSTELPDDEATTDDELCEIFSEGVFLQRVTDLLLESAPYLTGAQIVELRGNLLRFARKNGWVD
jgi:CspA family cold shock protein